MHMSYICTQAFSLNRLTVTEGSVTSHGSDVINFDSATNTFFSAFDISMCVPFPAISPVLLFTNTSH